MPHMRAQPVSGPRGSHATKSQHGCKPQMQATGCSVTKSSRLKHIFRPTILQGQPSSLACGIPQVPRSLIAVNL